MKKNHYEVFEELLDEAKKLDVTQLFAKAYGAGYNQGWDEAVEMLTKEELENEE